jgi:hypothetical protein
VRYCRRAFRCGARVSAVTRGIGAIARPIALTGACVPDAVLEEAREKLALVAGIS